MAKNKMAKNKNEWEWDRTRIILKDPKGEEVVLTSEHLNDQTMNNIFEDIEDYVEEEGGKLE
jgi:hypothetical protein